LNYPKFKDKLRTAKFFKNSKAEAKTEEGEDAKGRPRHLIVLFQENLKNVRNIEEDSENQ